LSVSEQNTLLNSYSVSGLTFNALSGAIDKLNYEGIHEIKVVGKNADNYNSVDVKVFTITYTNPCPASSIIPGPISPM